MLDTEFGRADLILNDRIDGLMEQVTAVNRTPAAACQIQSFASR
jgi:hypothetical protein